MIVFVLLVDHCFVWSRTPSIKINVQLCKPKIKKVESKQY